MDAYQVGQIDVTGVGDTGYAPDAAERVAALPDFEITVSLEPVAGD